MTDQEVLSDFYRLHEAILKLQRAQWRITEHIDKDSIDDLVTEAIELLEGMRDHPPKRRG